MNDDERGRDPPDAPPRGLRGQEWRNEMEERRERRKNVVIDGLTILEKEKKEALEEWVKKSMNLKVRVARLDRQGPSKWLARLEDMGHKKEMVREKGSLQALGWGVFLRDDFTLRQREVKGWLEREAERWRRRGKDAKTGYNWLTVDRTWVEFDEREGELRMKRQEREEKGHRGEPF